MPEQNNPLKRQEKPEHARDDRPENTARDAHKPASGGQNPRPGQPLQGKSGSPGPMSPEANKALGNRIEQGRQDKPRPGAEPGRKEQPKAEPRPDVAKGAEPDEADEPEEEREEADEADPKENKE